MAFLLQTKNYRYGGDSNLQKWDLQSHVPGLAMPAVRLKIWLELYVSGVEVGQAWPGD